MATTFAALMSGLREEAKAGGPEAVTQLEALGNRCRLGRQLAQARLDQNLSQAAVAKRRAGYFTDPRALAGSALGHAALRYS
jgi:hypothetical protein